jgi:hypothetical protein
MIYITAKEMKDKIGNGFNPHYEKFIRVYGESGIPLTVNSIEKWMFSSSIRPDMLTGLLNGEKRKIYEKRRTGTYSEWARLFIELYDGGKKMSLVDKIVQNCKG